MRTNTLSVAVLAVAGTLTSQVAAQETSKTTSETPPDRVSHLSVGFDLSSLSNDFGMGARVTSPFFARDTVAFRLQGGIHWKDGFSPGEIKSTWEHYGDLRLGVLAVGAKMGKYVRCYGEGGAVLLMPSSDLSDGLDFGGYGVFGVEFLGDGYSPVSYFLEAGGIGTGARASELLGDPLFANGFMMQVGIHWYPY